jgi:hypothetical protein
MKEYDIHFIPKAKGILSVTPFIFKKNDVFRYIFFPVLINDEKDETKSLRGEFVVQRKGINDAWEDVETLPINKMVKDTWIKLDLSSAPLELLIDYCIAIKKLAMDQGIKFSVSTEKKLFLIDKGLFTDDIKALMTNPDILPSLQKYFQSADSIDTVVKMFSEVNVNQFALKILDNSAEKLYISLKSRFINIDLFDSMLSKDSEPFWQEFFKGNPHILSMVIPSLFQIIQEQPYLGGKNISQKGSSLGDYIYKFGSKNTAIIEIKTPKSILMNSTAYRPLSGVFVPGKDLIGGIQQLHKQKDEYQKSFYQLHFQSDKNSLQSYEPQLFLIIGNTIDLTPDQLESFELFRNQQKNLSILTYNEISDKLKLIKEALSFSE